MPDPDEARRFDQIVAELRADRVRRLRGRWSLSIGAALCLLAISLITFGGVKGAVIAVLPWLIGIVLVIRSRAWH